MFTLLDELWTMFRRQIMIILIVFLGLWIIAPPVFDALIQWLFIDKLQQPWIVDIIMEIENFVGGLI